MSEIDNSRLIWIDLEMTGLDTLTDHILEIATVVTDKDLKILAEGPVLAIRISIRSSINIPLRRPASTAILRAAVENTMRPCSSVFRHSSKNT